MEPLNNMIPDMVRLIFLIKREKYFYDIQCQHGVYASNYQRTHKREQDERSFICDNETVFDYDRQQREGKRQARAYVECEEQKDLDKLPAIFTLTERSLTEWNYLLSTNTELNSNTDIK